MISFWEQYGAYISHSLLNIAVVIFFATLLSRGVSILEKVLIKRLVAKNFSTKTIAQVFKILIWCTAVIIIIATLMGKSPTFVLSGLGAFMAILMLIFKDSILGLVAGIQLSQNDMVRLGDWIEMPKYNADGTVIDIALTTVKVQNFDNTVTMLPSSALITDAFVNWRYMSESKGRRIKRPLWISTASIVELNDELRADLLAKGLIEKDDKPLSNLAAFEQWVRNYLKANNDISNELTCIVRQTEAKSEGVPIEIYCFTKTRDWAEYELIQTALFDKLFVMVPKFNLAIFERTGAATRKNI